MSIRDLWIEFVLRTCKQPLEVSTGVQAGYFNQTWVIPGEVWNQELDLSLMLLGYGKEGNKTNQLRRIYFNQDGFDQLRKVLQAKESRPYVSAGTHLQAGTKDARSSGHCIQSIVVTVYEPYKAKKRIDVDIFYRSTELVQKFGADLIFLHNHVLPYLLEGFEYPLYRVRFHFALCYFSFLFMPVMFQFVQPTDVFEAFRSSPPAIYRLLMRTATKYIVNDPEHYRYRSRRRMMQFFRGLLDRGIIAREEIVEYLRNHGAWEE